MLMKVGFGGGRGVARYVRPIWFFTRFGQAGLWCRALCPRSLLFVSVAPEASGCDMLLDCGVIVYVGRCAHRTV